MFIIKEDSMSVTQLSLFNEEANKVVEKEFIDTNINSKNSHIESMVSAYRILDKLTNRSYIGISIDPISRMSVHKKGKTSNKDLNNLMKQRPDDVQFEIIEEFLDPMYKSNNPESRAVRIEAFLIQVYDSIENGMNTALMFHHDYKDSAFWKEVLTDKLHDIYSVANHDLLNFRSRRNLYARTNSRKNNNPSNVEFKLWATEYMLELESKGIKVFVLAQELEKIDRSNLFRFLRQKDYGAVSDRKISSFIRKLENQFGMPHRVFSIEF